MPIQRNWALNSFETTLGYFMLIPPPPPPPPTEEAQNLTLTHAEANSSLIGWNSLITPLIISPIHYGGGRGELI